MASGAYGARCTSNAPPALIHFHEASPLGMRTISSRAPLLMPRTGSVHVLGKLAVWIGWPAGRSRNWYCGNMSTASDAKLRANASSAPSFTARIKPPCSTYFLSFSRCSGVNFTGRSLAM